MTQHSSPETAERTAFIEANRHLDLSEVPDAWGRPIFKHSHVQALWDGWSARASRIPAQCAPEAKLREALQKIADLIDSEAGEPLDDAIAIANRALALSSTNSKGTE